MANPKISIHVSTEEKLLDYLGFFILAYTIYITLSNYGILPDSIPVHFDINGNPDRYGSKNNVFLVPIIGAGTFLFLYFLNKQPHWFNYLKPITIENAEEQYTIATKMIRRLNLFTIGLMSYITYHMISLAKGESNPYGDWVIMSIVFIIVLLVAYYIYKSLQKN